MVNEKRRGVNLLEQSKGQVTIFIIIAIVIVALGVLVFMFYPQIKTTLGLGEKDPSSFMQTCLEGDLKANVEKISLQGGSLNPEHYYTYENEKVEYLCYAESYYVTCVVQQPMIREHIESEIKNSIKSQADSCLSSLEDNFKKAGYSVNLKQGDFDVELLPKRIVITFNNSLTLSKENTQQYDSIKVVLNNNLYETLGIVNSIIKYEAKLGDSETTLYMDLYHDIKVEKKKQTDGTKIYIITERDTKNKFQFASRSLAWPPGYGAGGVY